MLQWPVNASRERCILVDLKDPSVYNWLTWQDIDLTIEMTFQSPDTRIVKRILLNK